MLNQQVSLPQQESNSNIKNSDSKDRIYRMSNKTFSKVEKIMLYENINSIKDTIDLIVNHYIDSKEISMKDNVTDKDIIVLKNRFKRVTGQEYKTSLEQMEEYLTSKGLLTNKVRAKLNL